jgi:hypothetical protein
MIVVALFALCVFQPLEIDSTTATSDHAVLSSEVDPVEFTRGVRERYRRCDIHETYDIEVSQDFVETIRAQVSVFSGSDETGHRLMVEFGPFSMLVESSRIALIHRYNRKNVLVAEGRSAAELISESIPPLPIPQLPLLMQSDREDSAAFDELAHVGPWFDGLLVERVQREGDSMVADGRIRVGNSVRIEVDSDFRISNMVCQLDVAEQRGRLTLKSTVVAQRAVPTWESFIGGREKVSTIAELRSLPSEIKVGDRLPELGMLTDQLQPWSFDETITGAVALAPASRQFVVIVMYDCASEASRVDAVMALDAVREASRRSRRAAALGTGPMVRLTPVVAGAFALRSLSTDELLAEKDRWPAAADSELPEVDPVFAWVPAGADPISRFVPEARCVVVVVDGQRRVMAAIPFESGVQVAEVFTDELLGVVK